MPDVRPSVQWGGHSPRVGERQPDHFFAYCQGGCYWSSDSVNARRLALYHSRTHGHCVAVEVIATLVYEPAGSDPRSVE